MQQRLFGTRSPEPRTEAPTGPDVDLPDADGVKLAYALDGTRSVFAGELVRVSLERRRTYACVACEVPVHVVLPRQGAAKKVRPHFRHAQQSPTCQATSNQGALLWNVKCRLHAALSTPRPLVVRRYCTPHANPWATSPLLSAGSLFSAATSCEATRGWPVPPWARARLGRSPDLRLVGDDGPVLAIVLRTPSMAPPPPADPAWIEVDVTEASYERLMAWGGEDVLPAAGWSPALSWRCAAHR